MATIEFASQSSDTLTTGSSPVPLRIKLLFWLILSTLSTIFAEVVSFNTPLLFAFPTMLWVLLVMYPLYGLHAILLSGLLFRRGQSPFPRCIWPGRCWACTKPTG